MRERSLSRGASQSAVRRRWQTLCTVWPSHSQWTSEQISFITTKRLPILQLSCSFFGKASHYAGLLVHLEPRLGSLRLLALPKAKIAAEWEEICECYGHTVHKVSQRRLTADWLAPRESDRSRMRSKVSSDGCQVMPRPCEQFSRYSKWTDTFRTALTLVSEYFEL